MYLFKKVNSHVNSLFNCHVDVKSESTAQSYSVLKQIFKDPDILICFAIFYITAILFKIRVHVNFTCSLPQNDVLLLWTQ